MNQDNIAIILITAAIVAVLIFAMYGIGYLANLESKEALVWCKALLENGASIEELVRSGCKV